MAKKFKDELDRFHKKNRGLYNELEYYKALEQSFENWHSDEEFQALKSKFKPLIPGSVAKFIDELKREDYDIEDALSYECSIWDVEREAAVKWKDENLDKFAGAWLYGYKVSE